MNTLNDPRVQKFPRREWKIFTEIWKNLTIKPIYPNNLDTFATLKSDTEYLKKKICLMDMNDD